MIKLMDKSRIGEVMDLWLRTAPYSNSFVEPDFWETHCDFIKENYIEQNDTFIYEEDGIIKGFACVSADNKITGLFVAPESQNKGIGTELVEFLKTEYSLLHANIYLKNRKAIKFSARLGFVIDGALLHEHNNEIMYTMMWNR